MSNILAGYAVVGRGRPDALPWLLAASAGLYAGGVVLNDYFDREVDAVERPERPIPSGRVAGSHALVLGCVAGCRRHRGFWRRLGVGRSAASRFAAV